ncbi:MAG: ATP-binding protein [Bacillota bacterium]|nr:ATP-binding protein [Bacillota bacterium]
MEELKRDLEPMIESWLFKGKIITIFGPRQVGKTTLAKRLLTKHGSEKNYFNCDIPSIAQSFENPEPLMLKRIIDDARFIVIDEAQRISNMGLTLKIIHDTMPGVQVIATGSSSFKLGANINEPLTGRGIEFLLLPFSLNELKQIYRPHEIDSLLPFFMRYGLYPEIVDKSEAAAETLIVNLASKYLFKDILEFESLKKPEMLTNILQLIALQLGNEVSRNEIASRLNTSRQTIERYLDLLEKSFVIFRLKPLSRNKRNEIARKEKIYFYDTGIRNSIISAFQSLDLRQDTGALFENFMITERLKYLQFQEKKRNLWFWRTHDGKEIDYIEEYDGRFYGFELKWNKGKTKKSTIDSFRSSYGETPITTISRANYFEFF